MHTRTKLLIDRALAAPVAWGLNGTARALGHLMRRSHKIVPSEVETIVVSKIIGLGSIVQATPMLRAMRRAFPAARIIFLSSSANRSVLERIPMIDDVVLLRDDAIVSLAMDTANASVSLARTGVDIFFDLEVYSAGAAALAALSLARNRVGFYRHSARFKHGNYTHLVFFNTRIHVSDLYLHLLRATGIEVDEPHTLGPLIVREEDRAEFRRVTPIEGRFVAVNPNASDLLIERRWPKERFAELIVHLTGAGFRVALTGSRGEAAYVAELRASLPEAARERTVDTAGRLSLGGFLGLLEAASCVVTNDTGPMHLAGALGRPMVCMFGPGSPTLYGIDAPNVETLYHAVVCSPCIYETEVPPCAGANVCMQRIPTEAVVAAVHRVLLGVPFPGSLAPPHRSLPLIEDASITLDDEGRPLGVLRRASVPP